MLDDLTEQLLGGLVQVVGLETVGGEGAVMRCQRLLTLYQNRKVSAGGGRAKCEPGSGERVREMKPRFSREIAKARVARLRWWPRRRPSCN